MAFLLVLFGLLMLIFLNKTSWRNVGLAVCTGHRAGVTHINDRNHASHRG